MSRNAATYPATTAAQSFSTTGTGVTPARRLAHRKTQSGFALLEVMVAFIIAALALGVLLQTGLSSLRSIQTAAKYEEALARARSRLAIATHGAPVKPGELQGDDGGGFRWRVIVKPAGATSVRPLGMTGPNRPPRVPLTLYAISVWVWWTEQGSEDEDSRRQVRLDSHLVQTVVE
jgi:general secretion pathway protein I